MNRGKMNLFSIYSFLFIYLTSFKTGTPKSLSETKISDHPVILVVSFDGFRYDYMTKVNTPALDALKSESAYVPYMEPVFPTKTFPNHMSISTGTFSETHGIVDNALFDPKYNKFLSGYDDDPGFWNYSSEILPIWIHNEMAGGGRVSGAMMWPGSSQPYGAASDKLPTYYYPKYDGSVQWEERVDTAISWITNPTKPANLVFLYHEEPDSKGHAFGPDGEVTLKEVENTDKRAAYLIDKLKEFGIFEKINLIVVSDHGMMGVSQDRLLYINESVNHDLVGAQYGSTPFLQYIPKDGKTAELYENLKDICLNKNEKCSVWNKGELQHPYHYSSSRRVLGITVIADAGYGFDDFEDTIKYYNGRWNLTANASREYGVHGYYNLHASMKPIFIAHGPAFRHGYDFSPIKNVDIVPMISSILNIPEPPNNGSLARVQRMMDPKYLSGSGQNPTPDASLRISLMALVSAFASNRV